METEITVDLLVPASVNPGSGRRGARLIGHDVRAARIVRGLDGAIVDADVMTLSALDRNDPRTFDLRVDGRKRRDTPFEFGDACVVRRLPPLVHRAYDLAHATTDPT
ncbi:MAG TPA: hypothetical protein VFN67_08905, partial [Polyangiales bacterium]|nr:hypothetical protein [Polyangiales bacterium]